MNNRTDKSDSSKGCNKCIQTNCPYLQIPSTENIIAHLDKYGLKHIKENFVCLYDMHIITPKSLCKRVCKNEKR